MTNEARMREMKTFLFIPHSFQKMSLQVIIRTTTTFELLDCGEKSKYVHVRGEIESLLSA